MANLQHGPKVRELTSKETISSLESWKANVLYGLRLNRDFREYLQDGFVFGKKTRAHPHRQLHDVLRTETINRNGQDEEVQIVAQTRQARANDVDLLLDQISNYCPNIPRNSITKDCGSLSEVWNTIRMFYDLQHTGSLLNEVWNVRRESDETPQALYARMKQLYDNNLLTAGGLNHIDGELEEDEEMSPTLSNTIVLHWLQVLHPDLRDLVTQRFITQLRDNTYAALFPEISRSVTTLLEELTSGATINRTFNKSFSHNKPSYKSSYKPSYSSNSYKPSSYPSSSSNKKHCDFCKLTGKRMFHTHNIDECYFIKRLNSKTEQANQVESEETYDDIDLHYKEFLECTGEDVAHHVEHIINQVNIDASPVLQLNTKDDSCEITLDTGATCSIIAEEEAHRIDAKIRHTSQKVRMADGKSPLEVVGETDVTLYRNRKPYKLSAIVCRNTDTKILAGMPFMRSNDIAIRPFANEIIIGGTEFIKYNPQRISSRFVRRITTSAKRRQVILPGQSIELEVADIHREVAIEPRWDSAVNKKHNKESLLWPQPQTTEVVDGKVTLYNTQNEPIIIHKNEPVCNVYPSISLPSRDNTTHQIINTTPQPSQNKPSSDTVNTPPKPANYQAFSDSVNLNPDGILSQQEEAAFSEILKTYDAVFSPADNSTYNGYSGPCFVEVNMGPNLPPQWKGHTPFYSDTGLQELQDKFDELHSQGILSRPQEIGVSVENVNPSFMVRKQPPSTDKRLVTDFKSIAGYCRPTPSLLPDVETTLRRISKFKFLIKTDMSKAYHQIKMKKASQRFCGVHTPFKGLLVYNVGSMGLPGVEVALEELTCLILGTLVKDGKVCKLADDLFIGGDTIVELKNNFHLVLDKLLKNNIKLSPTKTVIVPKSVTILGWVWKDGQLSASPHKLSALATCPPPATITALKSYLGAYRFLSRLIRAHANLLAPLEEEIKGKDSKHTITWSESLIQAFKKTQEALSDIKSITIPHPSDMLSIVTDASVRPGAIGATLYVIRNNKPKLAGFFNSKLPEFKKRWLPCELEALSITTALHHFAPFIIQSSQKPQVLTDSMPCVDAVKKLGKGEFSASTRLTTFLSSVSRYGAEVKHIPGSMNLVSDYASRHPLECSEPSICSICKFVQTAIESVVHKITVEDVIEGRSSIPWTNRGTWREVQNDCSIL